MEKAELTALVVKAQSGDPRAMEELLRTAHTPVSYQCRKLLRDPRDAEDMTQEVLLAVYTKLDSLKTPEAFWGWLNTMTANRCVNALKRSHAELPFAEDEEGHSVLDGLEELDEQQMPDKVLDNAETTRMIEEIVDGLPESQRLCVLMYYYDEMSVKDIAAALGVPENTVKSRLNYARKAVKEKVLGYEEQGGKLYSLPSLSFLGCTAESADSVRATDAARQAMELGASARAATTGGAAAGWLSVKLVAGALAGLLAVGGITMAVILTVRNAGASGSAVSKTVPVEGAIPAGAEASSAAPETPNGYPLDPRWDELRPGQTAVQIDDVYVQSGMTLREVAEALAGSDSDLRFAQEWDADQALSVGPDHGGSWTASPISADIYYGGAPAFTICYFAGLPGNPGETYRRGDCPVFAVLPTRKTLQDHIVTRMGAVGGIKAMNLTELDQFTAAAFPDGAAMTPNPWGKNGRHIEGHIFTTRRYFEWNGYAIYYDSEPGFPSVTTLEFYEDTGELFPATWELDQPQKALFHELGRTTWRVEQ